MALANDKCWSGAFVMWPDQKLLVYRYSLNLAGGAQATPEQIQDMLRNAVMAAEDRDRLAAHYVRPETFDNELRLAWTYSQVQLRHLGVTLGGSLSLTLAPTAREVNGLAPLS